MILKAVYPVLMWFSKKPDDKSVITANGEQPAVSFYSLNDTLINGQPFALEQLKGKKVLLVNTASDCGYTAQYEDLEKLSKKFENKLTVIGFPSNDFNDQEKGDDSAIEKFCKLNYGVSFLLMKKSAVKPTPGQNKIYQWLTDAKQNGWNNKKPDWNFSKYLVDENGKLINYFGPTVSPLDDKLTKRITE